MSVVIETTLGDITIDLFLKERPRACLNFIKLCKLKYYNFNLFHTVERNFIAQTGDPSGVGDSGESVWGVIEGVDKKFFEAEFLPKVRHTHPGLLSFVSVGKNMIGSQFFFTLGSELTSLDGMHCVFGEVMEGHEVLRKLNESIVDDKFRPYQDVRITHTVILEDPFSDPRGFKVPERSPSPTPERLKNGKVGADEDIDDTDGKTATEIQEMLAAKEAKARATILEIVGDLPDAECAPPENVLFVCKLNPVTTDDDLEIIFSRFGKVVNCEVIRDRQTEDSLQYAFIEFEDQKSCESAYFKMDNVLIDDRRIHVDFSQSVSRVKWKGKGRGVETSGKLDFNNLKDDDRKRDSYQERRMSPQRNYHEQDRRNRNQERRNHDQDRRNHNQERRNYRGDSPSREVRNTRDDRHRDYRRSPQRIHHKDRRERSPHRTQRNYSDSSSQRPHLVSRHEEKYDKTKSSEKDNRKEKKTKRRDSSSSSSSSSDPSPKKKKKRKHDKSKKSKKSKQRRSSSSS